MTNTGVESHGCATGTRPPKRCSAIHVGFCVAAQPCIPQCTPVFVLLAHEAPPIHPTQAETFAKKWADTPKAHNTFDVRAVPPMFQGACTHFVEMRPMCRNPDMQRTRDLATHTRCLETPGACTTESGPKDACAFLRPQQAVHTRHLDDCRKDSVQRTACAHRRVMHNRFNFSVRAR